MQPLFATDDRSLAGDVEALPGLRRHHVDSVGDVAAAIAEAGGRGIIVFGVPARKDDAGSAAWDEDGVVPRAIRAVRHARIDIAIIADVCLCQYTIHGQCGIVADGRVVNDATLEALGRASVAYAAAGASLVAPSGMMDGSVAAILAVGARGGAGSAHGDQARGRRSHHLISRDPGCSLDSRRSAGVTGPAASIAAWRPPDRRRRRVVHRLHRLAGCGGCPIHRELRPRPGLSGF